MEFLKKFFFQYKKHPENIQKYFKCKRCPEYVQYQCITDILKILINFCSEVVKSGQF